MQHSFFNPIPPFRPIRFASGCAGLVLLLAVPVAAQVSEPTEEDFFATAAGNWCRLDTRGTTTIEIDFPSEVDGELTVNLVSDRLTVETTANFVSFGIVEEELGEFEEPVFDSIIAFSGSSILRRASDGSIVPSNFEQSYIFNRTFTRMSSIDSNGRPSGIYVRCTQITDGVTPEVDPGADSGADSDGAVSDVSEPDDTGAPVKVPEIAPLTLAPLRNDTLA